MRACAEPRAEAGEAALLAAAGPVAASSTAGTLSADPLIVAFGIVLALLAVGVSFIPASAVPFTLGHRLDRTGRRSSSSAFRSASLRARRPAHRRWWGDEARAGSPRSSASPPFRPLASARLAGPRRPSPRAPGSSGDDELREFMFSATRRRQFGCALDQSPFAAAFADDAGTVPDGQHHFYVIAVDHGNVDRDALGVDVDRRHDAARCRAAPSGRPLPQTEALVGRAERGGRRPRRRLPGHHQARRRPVRSIGAPARATSTRNSTTASTTSTASSP